MTGKATSAGALLTYRVRARNIATDSENKIHDDEVAARFGFRGGLVPGVAVFGYMTVPIVARFERDWIERGSMQVKFHQPFYEGEQVLIRAEVDGDCDPVKVTVTAELADGVVCATGLATINDRSAWLGEPRLDDYPERSLPPPESRPPASRETIAASVVLGTLAEKLDLGLIASTLLEKLDERLPVYYGSRAVAHPTTLLSMANYVLMRNFDLGPWIHTASDLINWSAAHDGERISARARVRDQFARKGHEFVVLDVLLVAGEDRIVQQVRHTAIYRPRPAGE